MRGGVTDAGRTTEQTVKIELLSQLKLEAEFHNLVNICQAKTLIRKVRCEQSEPSPPAPPCPAGQLLSTLCPGLAPAWIYSLFILILRHFPRLENLKPVAVAGQYHDVSPLSDTVILTNVHTGLEVTKKGKNPGKCLLTRD